VRSVPAAADESDGILNYLYQHMENPLFQCRFRWRENSMAFWDNRCVQHRAMWDYWPHTRSGNRVTVAGDKPTDRRARHLRLRRRAGRQRADANTSFSQALKAQGLDWTVH